MGTFHESFEIAAGPDGPFETIEALVDTGATYTLVPAPILKRLGVEPNARREFAIADGSRIFREVGDALIRLDDEEHYTLVVFGDDGADALLGAVTLEAFGLAVDPLSQQLRPVHGYLVGLQPEGGS